MTAGQMERHPHKWMAKQIKEFKTKRASECDPSKLFDWIDGKGIGCEFLLPICFGNMHGAIYSAIDAGYIELVGLKLGSFMGLSVDGANVRLTKKGMDYYDSLPKLQLECA